MALGLGISLIFGDLAGAGSSSTAVVIEDYMWVGTTSTGSGSTYDAVTPIPTLYDFNDTWDLDTATGLVNGLYDYTPTDPDDELEETYDEGYWNVDASGDVQPIDPAVFPNPYNSEG
tara:strand:+ start:1192 stop:1542 length:351 start_codon:yes stop_codon:yes gene_type:complete